jgi:hypothetical protein
MKLRNITVQSVIDDLAVDSAVVTGGEYLDRTLIDRISAEQHSGPADTLKAVEIENIKLRKQVGELVTQILALRGRLQS